MNVRAVVDRTVVMKSKVEENLFPFRFVSFVAKLFVAKVTLHRPPRARVAFVAKKPTSSRDVVLVYIFSRVPPPSSNALV